MERGLQHVLHSLLLGILAYVLMIYVLKQRQAVAEDRSVLLAGVALIYMVLFGHKLPTSVNKNIF